MNKQIIFIFFFIIVCLWILFRLWLNGLGLNGSGVSASIAESKQLGVFVAKYEIDSVQASVFDSLDKYKIYYLDTAKMEIWVEKRWHMVSKYIFFRPLQIAEEDNRLVYKNQLRFTDDYEVGMRMEGDPYNGFNQSQEAVVVDSKENEMFAENLVFELYLYPNRIYPNPFHNREEAPFIGKIFLKRTELVKDFKFEEDFFLWHFTFGVFLHSY